MQLQLASLQPHIHFYLIKSTIQVIGIDHNRYSNLHKNNHIQNQQEVVKIFRWVKNHFYSKQGATSSNIHQIESKHNLKHKTQYIYKI